MLVGMQTDIATVENSVEFPLAFFYFVPSQSPSGQTGSICVHIILSALYRPFRTYLLRIYNMGRLIIFQIFKFSDFDTQFSKTRGSLPERMFFIG